MSLRGRDLKVSFDGAELLREVTLHAAEGEMVGLIGPNGAGKSTLLRILAGVRAPEEGHVEAAEVDVHAAPAKAVARRMTMVEQTPSLGFGFTAAEVVMMGRHPHLSRFEVESEEDRGIVGRALTATGTAHLAHRDVTTLSGGERQLVFIARALAQQPRILLLDEPVSALDLRHQLVVLRLARELAHGGLTVVTALHDLDLAARFCDRLCLLAGGRLLAAGTAEEVLTPELIRRAYGVEATVRPCADTGALSVTALAPIDAPQHERNTR